MLPGFACLPRAAILAARHMWRVCVSEGAAHIAARASLQSKLAQFEIAGPAVRENENKRRIISSEANVYGKAPDPSEQ